MTKPGPRVGISTAAETAWYEREHEPEHHEHADANDRWLKLILFGAAFAIAGGVLGVVLWLA